MKQSRVFSKVFSRVLAETLAEYWQGFWQGNGRAISSGVHLVPGEDW